MEYLAAVGAANLAQQAVAPLVERLAAHLDQSEWHEVILLTIGVLGIVQGRDGAAGDVVQGLINSGQGEPGRAIVLAGEAVADAYPGGVTPACQQVVVQELVKTLRNDKVVKPILRAHAGRTLARLGDPRPEVMTIEGMEFCYVPPGPFIMGSGDDDPMAYADEKPQHTYNIPYGYWIGRFPVTNAQFAPFVEAGGYKNPLWWTEAQIVGFWQSGRVQDIWYEQENKVLLRQFLGWRTRPKDYAQPLTLSNHPRLGVSWYESIAYTRWLTNFLHVHSLLAQDWKVCLPTETEWEKAARGGEQLLWQPYKRTFADGLQSIPTSNRVRHNKMPNRRFPWGNEVDTNRMNYKETQIVATNTVGIFPRGRSPYGAEELSGNYWEWTSSLWGKTPTNCIFTYPYQLDDGREQLDAPIDNLRILRGGAYGYVEKDVRVTTRHWNGPDGRLVALRLVVSPSTFEI